MPIIGKLTSATVTITRRFLSNSFSPVLNCLKRKDTNTIQKTTPYWHNTSRNILCVIVTGGIFIGISNEEEEEVIVEDEPAIEVIEENEKVNDKKRNPLDRMTRETHVE